MSHNTFGHLFRVTTWGESHGPAIGAVVDGCPPLIPISEAEIQHYMDKRRPGQSRFTTQRREPDAVKILSGVFEDEASGQLLTTGTPISLFIENVDQRSKDYGDIKDKYRPGHADFTYQVKYGIRDWRGSGRASARETASRVAAGAIARKVVPGMTVRGALVQVGPHAIDRVALGLGRGRPQPVLLPGRQGGRAVGRLSRRRAQGRLVGRRRDRGRGRGRAAGPRRADLRQARSGHRLGDDVDQRGQGRRDRRRLRRRRALRRGERRRDAHRRGRPAAFPLQPCRRHSRRHLHRPAGGRSASPSSRPRRSSTRAAPSTRPARRSTSPPRAATTPASASARFPSARRCWPSCLPITISGTVARSASRPGVRTDQT